ncbi:RNA methyltransferase [Enterovibrio sp. ZSDZ35]|uniref:RNA methyltransferase n=1 Tax=Enterovibrio qingdaonensis TaxID=2899818 RepID=A0ABT5QJZ9_9GAMM|nr:RNA methyltransferase [Enterovibrio sp. ZSDZ35]MDD1780993.1 RNA methyltransferase [Enterovibrio sp. ZSDZ35]
MNNTTVIIGLDNPKSPSNVGAVLRAARCYQAGEVRYTGVRYDRAAKFYTDTQDAIETIPLTGVASLTESLDESIEVVCVELAVGATSLPSFQHPEKAIYIFGPEDGSIAKDIVQNAHHVVYVPTIGCMNLAATVNVVLYDRLVKSDSIEQGDELIKASRDNRNRLVVNQ